jgi:hypothetical protein
MAGFPLAGVKHFETGSPATLAASRPREFRARDRAARLVGRRLTE